MPGAGPILIFDKSALQGLSADEALWLDCFYNSNITPLFYVETLADLYKEMRRGRTPEDVVRDIAAKTPNLASGVNADHRTLCINDLLGNAVPMNRFPVTLRGRSVLTGDRLGIVIERPTEMEALERWQQGDYLAVERLFAKSWRRDLSRYDLSEVLVKSGLPKGARLMVRNLAEAKEWADRFVRGERNRFSTLKGALETLGVPRELWAEIIRRWKSDGGPPLRTFAPYAAHVFSVDIFFFISLAAGQISTERASNVVDMAYLYYLPFCMIFASGDKLHRRTAPLFLEEDQAFLWAPDMKADLAQIDNHFSQLPESVREQGVFSFAQYPPLGTESATRQMWDRFLPRWQDSMKEARQKEKGRDQELMQMLDEMNSAPEVSQPVGSDDAKFMIIRRQVTACRGKWRVLPKEVIERSTH